MSRTIPGAWVKGALAVGALLLQLLPLTLHAIELPGPSGPHPVGTSIYRIVDPSRGVPAAEASGRALTVQFWFPAEQGSAGAAAPYLPEWEVVESLPEAKYFQQTRELLKSWRSLESGALANAAPMRVEGGIPLVLFAPGLGVIRSNYTLLAEDLASHGYAVAILDPPYGAMTRNSGGRLLSSSEDEGFSEDIAVVRAYEEAWGGDLSFVLDWLQGEVPPVLARRLALDRVVVGGHSLGGAAAFDAGRRDKRFRACFNLDGLAVGRASQEGTGVPTLFVKAVPVYTDEDLARRGRTRADWDAMGVEMRSHVVAPLEIRGHPQSAFIEFRETGHMSFSDAPFVMPDTITRFGGELLDALRTREILSRILLAFLGEQLQGSEDTIADVAEEFEEIALIRPVHRRTSAP